MIFMNYDDESIKKENNLSGEGAHS